MTLWPDVSTTRHKNNKEITEMALFCILLLNKKDKNMY